MDYLRIVFFLVLTTHVRTNYTTSTKGGVVMGKYTKEAKQILKAIGQDNIQGLSHCVTRLRFELDDASKVDKISIEEISLVKGIVEQSGQFQVIIGN